ncbi:ABC transporter substrate-binding protein [Leisingera methylohalidivorans]|uniref:Peptide ABC transporter substrate-binding protein n=1 Tax=Leisingera methylohalidivorans DSM 14336 TaxID=999552 RepID=V9W099_9RHOB|nr:ABC transporter substrate-binding protein [Leisingera methylohalidivorans]AHD02587.1 peptide ABC transporter substrate-binding protein [Leisingera methylohalidivorans DSM 14336]
MTRIDRRALFTSGAAAALLAAAGGSVNASPKAGGVLRLAVPREGGMLEQAVRGAVYDTLTEIASDGLLRGELATGWHSTQDAKTWTFDLRAGVTFHDGTLFAAEDAAASLATQGIAGAEVQAITALGSRQLLIELTQTNPHLPYLLAGADQIVAPGGELPVPLSDAIGTGCYKVERAQEGRHFRACSVEHHYKSGTAGWAQTVEIIVIPDAEIRAEALRDGYVDVAALPEPRGLLKRGAFLYHPSSSDMALAARRNVGIPRTVGRRGPLDDGRIAERWWLT